MRTVMIATPAYDGKVDARYLDSLMGSLRALNGKDIALYPFIVPNEAILSKARNELLKISLELFEGKGVDDVVFIDNDIVWRGEDLLKLLEHDVDIVGGLCPLKDDRNPRINVRNKKGAVLNEKTSLIEVEATGCGFLRMRISAVRKLWNSSRKYHTGEIEGRMVFEVMTDATGDLYSEDIAMCHKWAKLKGKIYVDVSILCQHVGTKVYTVQDRRN